MKRWRARAAQPGRRGGRPLVQQLVNHVLSAGAWLETAQANRDVAAEVAGGPTMFNQQPEILKHVLPNPRDRVTYADLRLIQSEMDELMEAALERLRWRSRSASLLLVRREENASRTIGY